MHNTERNMTAASIRYLLAVHALCAQGQGARCVDVAERLGVTKPSAHAMIESLCPWVWPRKSATPAYI